MCQLGMIIIIVLPIICTWTTAAGSAHAYVAAGPKLPAVDKKNNNDSAAAQAKKMHAHIAVIEDMHAK